MCMYLVSTYFRIWIPAVWGPRACHCSGGSTWVCGRFSYRSYDRVRADHARHHRPYLWLQSRRTRKLKNEHWTTQSTAHYIFMWSRNRRRTWCCSWCGTCGTCDWRSRCVRPTLVVAAAASSDHTTTGCCFRWWSRCSSTATVNAAVAALFFFFGWSTLAQLLSPPLLLL